MNLHENKFCFDFWKDLIDHQKRIVRTVVHIDTADEIDHSHITEFGFVHAPTVSGHLRRIVGGAEDAAIFIQIVADLFFSKTVVA